jgi:hypothetical protein
LHLEKANTPDKQKDLVMKQSITSIWLAGLLFGSAVLVGCGYLVAGTTGAVLAGLPVAAFAVLLFLSFAAAISGRDTDDDGGDKPEDAADAIRDAADFVPLAYKELRRPRRQARLR